MRARTKESILKALKKECTALAKTRDNLRDLQEELDQQVTDSEEATELLEECISKLSELN